MTPAGIEARLAAQSMPPLRFVGKAAEIEAAMKQGRGVPASPAAYVVPISDRAARNRAATVVTVQELTTVFGVVIAVRELADAAGGLAAETLDTVRKAVRADLVGWVPEDGDDPIEYQSGDLVALANGVTWWLDQYVTRSHLRS